MHIRSNQFFKKKLMHIQMQRISLTPFSVTPLGNRSYQVHNSK
jgi:hypothetical protein